MRELDQRNDYSWVGKSRQELDLLDRNSVMDYLSTEKPDIAIIAAAKVGGILANRDYPVDFLSENLQIATNLLDGCHNAKINRLVFLGSSCIYPKTADQPIKESSLLSGQLEESNEAYALAKIAGLKLTEAYRRQYGHDWISAMPTNLYGPGDNFDPLNSHVLPALIRKFHDAKNSGLPNVTLWGTGTPKREFLHVDDFARAILYLIEGYHERTPINVGSSDEVTISDLATLVAETVGYQGEIRWDSSFPDGVPRKLLDSSEINKLGWRPKIPLKDGLAEVYEWFVRSES